MFKGTMKVKISEVTQSAISHFSTVRVAQSTLTKYVKASEATQSAMSKVSLGD